MIISSRGFTLVSRLKNSPQVAAIRSTVRSLSTDGPGTPKRMLILPSEQFSGKSAQYPATSGPACSGMFVSCTMSGLRQIKSGWNIVSAASTVPSPSNSTYRSWSVAKVRACRARMSENTALCALMSSIDSSARWFSKVTTPRSAASRRVSMAPVSETTIRSSSPAISLCAATAESGMGYTSMRSRYMSIMSAAQ